MTEAQLQRMCAQFLDLKGFLWFHTPNEGKRKRSTGGALVGAGLKKGVPDILIMDRPALFAGAAFELKVGKNNPTATQLHWLEELAVRGWYVETVRTFDRFRAAIAELFGDGPRSFHKRVDVRGQVDSIDEHNRHALARWLVRNGYGGE